MPERLSPSLRQTSIPESKIELKFHVYDSVQNTWTKVRLVFHLATIIFSLKITNYELNL